MKDNLLRSLVSEAVQLDRAIKDQTERLKELKSQLVTEASSRADEAAPTEGGGTGISFIGDDGSVARINFPAPSLKDKIDGEGKTIEKIKATAGRFFDKLFRPAIAYRPIDNFREEAEALMGKPAAKLIDLCEKDSSPRVSFETAE